MKDAFRTIELMVDGSRSELERDFGLCSGGLSSDENVYLFVSMLAEIFGNTVQYNTREGYNVERLCKDMMMPGNSSYANLVNIHKVICSYTLLS